MEVKEIQKLDFLGPNVELKPKSEIIYMSEKFISQMLYIFRQYKRLNAKNSRFY